MPLITCWQLPATFDSKHETWNLNLVLRTVTDVLAQGVDHEVDQQLNDPLFF